MKGQEKYNSPFATNLRKLIAQKGTTITALSKTLGISRQAVSQYTDGTGQPNVDKQITLGCLPIISWGFLIFLPGMRQYGVSTRKQDYGRRRFPLSWRITTYQTAKRLILSVFS